MTDAPDMRPMDWTEVAARAHEAGRKAGLEQAAAWLDGMAEAASQRSQKLHDEGSPAHGGLKSAEAAGLRRGAAAIRVMMNKP